MKQSSFIIIALLALFSGILVATTNLLFGLGFVFLVVAVALILFDYRKAVFVLGFYVLIDYFTRGYIPFLATIWDELALIALFALWGYKFLVYRKEDSFKRTPLDVPILLYFAVNIFLMLIRHDSFRIAVDGMRANIQFIIWYFVIVELLKEKRDIAVLCHVLVFSGFLLGLHGVYQYITKVPMPQHWIDSMEAGVATRAFSIIGSPNILGSLMALLAPIAFSFALADKKIIRKLIYLGMSGIMLLCLLVTFSRGAWIGFAIAVLIYILFIDWRLLIPAVIAGFLVFIFVPSVSGRILYMLSPAYIESSLRGGRLVRWITGISLFREAPFFGLGLGHWGGAVAMNNEMTRLIDSIMAKTFYMDNYYLKLAVEGGLVLLLTYLNLIYQTLAWVYTTIKHSKDHYYRNLLIGIFSGIAAVIAHNFTENVFEVPMMTTYFWMLVACAMEIWYLESQAQKNKASDIIPLEDSQSQTVIAD